MFFLFILLIVFAANLKIVASSTLIRHPLIGLEFDRFDGRRYVMNAEKRARYPDDDAAAQALLKY